MKRVERADGNFAALVVQRYLFINIVRLVTPLHEDAMALQPSSTQRENALSPPTLCATDDGGLVVPLVMPLTSAPRTA